MKEQGLRRTRAQAGVARFVSLLFATGTAVGSSGACASLTGLSSYAEGDGSGSDGSVSRPSDAFAPPANDGAAGAGDAAGSGTDDSTDEATGAPGDDGSLVNEAGGRAGGGDGSPVDEASVDAAGGDTGAADAAGDAGCGNVTSDKNNCGGCGYVCATGTTCTGGQCVATSKGAFACATSLADAPVCDAKHDYCLCTDDSECNSNGLDVVNNGGCNSGQCTGTCKGGQFTDSAGCSIVAPTCNVGGTQGCPAKTVCEVNHGGCGGSAQCCWCTSDSACPVSMKCVNDPTQNQCSGQGPCTGSGSSYDGMHCQLASPGIPLCTTQYACSVGNCDDVTSSSGACSATGTACWCTADAQCPSHGCASWAGCAAGACTGQGQTDSFHCVR
jgi:hypothetical protein